MSTEMVTIGDRTIEQFFDAVLSELSNFTVELDDDPLQKGPGALNEKIAQCRRYISRCENFSITAGAAESRILRKLRVLEAEYELRRNDLIVNNARVRAGRSDKERDAIIRILLHDLVQEMQQWKGDEAEIKQLAVMIKATRTDLKDVEARIKDQMSLCRQDIRLGSEWGSASFKGTVIHDLFDEEPAIDMKALPRKNMYGSDAVKLTTTEEFESISGEVSGDTGEDTTKEVDLDKILGEL